jgi:hypothetical protein
MADRAHLERLTKELVDSGKLIEAGWTSLRLMVIPLDASAMQLREMRMAFFAGAQHVFGSIMTFMEEGEEPTERDLERMDKIHQELEAFIAEIRKRFPEFKLQ